MKSAILITYDKEDAINEASALCDAAGYKIGHIIKQKFLKSLVDVGLAVISIKAQYKQQQNGCNLLCNNKQRNYLVISKIIF